MSTHTSRVLVTAALLLSITPRAFADPPPDDSERGPVAGFMLQGRFSQALGGATFLSRDAPVLLPSTPIMPAVIGYRGSFFAVGVGPTLWTSDRTGSSGSAGTLFGVGLHAEFVVGRFLQRRAEAYLFPGATVLFTSAGGTGSSSTQIMWGFDFGFGGRYWVTRGLGVQIELSESITSSPGASTGSSTADYRVVTLQTIGSIGLTIVLGDR